MSVDADITSSIPAASHLSEPQAEIVKQLAVKHGKPRLAYEENGLHAYFASPIALDKDGDIELFKRHLSVNIEKFVEYKETTNFLCFCHKYDKSYSVEELLNFISLQERGFSSDGVLKENDLIPLNALNLDEEGELVPVNPGFCLAIDQLKNSHPAIQYLNSREGGPFDLGKLYEQFDTSYCLKANQEVYGHYKEHTNGFKKDTTGRLVFYITALGTNYGFQARVLDASDGTYLYYYQHNAAKWIPVYVLSETLPSHLREKTQNKDKKWTLLPEYKTDNYIVDIPKYIIGTGTRKSKALMGFDCALNHAKNFDTKIVYCVEGPLDAARVYQAGFPAVAVIGKYVSAAQANLLCNYFDSIYVLADNDAGGDTLCERLQKQLSPYGHSCTVIKVPSELKDVGSMTPDNVKLLINRNT